MLLNVCLDVLQTYNNNELIQSYWSGLLLILSSGSVMLDMLYNTFTEDDIFLYKLKCAFIYKYKETKSDIQAFC